MMMSLHNNCGPATLAEAVPQGASPTETMVVPEEKPVVEFIELGQDCATYAILSRILRANGRTLASHELAQTDRTAYDYIASHGDGSAAYYRYVAHAGGFAATCIGGPFRVSWNIAVLPRW